MRLWSIQTVQAYEELLSKGVLYTNEKLSMAHEEPIFKVAYRYMMKQFAFRLSTKISNYPIWSWYWYDGKLKPRPDLRCKYYDTPGTKLVRLTLDVPDNEVLLSDFNLFYFVLNDWYIPKNQQDLEKYDKLKITLTNDELNKLKQDSWDLIFDLEREDDDNFMFGKKDKKIIQAITACIKIDQVKKVDYFIAR